MNPDKSRRFSLDKSEPDSKVLNRIKSADGDETLGNWDGNSIYDLVKELDRIEEFADANYASLPHQANVPEDLRPPVAIDFPIWTCDKNGLCLTGENCAEIVMVDDVRKYYQKEFGGVDQFKDKIIREISERNQRLKDN